MVLRKKKQRGNTFRFVVTAAGAVLALLCTAGCSVFAGDDEYPGGEPDEVTLILSAEGARTKSDAPDEDLVTDMNVFVINSHGLIEDSAYLTSSELVQESDGGFRFTTAMLRGCTYSILACANTGFDLSNYCDGVDDLLSYRFYMAYPDDYRIGVAMSGQLTDMVYKGESVITVPLKRAMAKVSVSIDRSALDDDVNFNVTGIKVGNCPKSVTLFSDSAVRDGDDTYTAGYRLSDTGVYNLNRNVSGKVSGEVSLYLFENMQGSPLGDIAGYSDKEFDEDDPMRDRCSYIELSVDYISDSFISSEGDLIYRFYIGESPSDFNVERNCHYHVVLRPEGTGLGGGGWMVDKSGIEYCGPSTMSVSPGEYIYGKIGDVIDVRVITDPEYTPIEIDYELIDGDVEDGIYEYTVDEDGRGLTLTLTGWGTGMLYFWSKYDDEVAELVIVVVGFKT